MAGSDGAGSVAERFKGLVLSIPTVFDGQGEVDVPAMEQLTEWYVGHGVHGFFVLGSKGLLCSLVRMPQRNRPSNNRSLPPASDSAPFFRYPQPSGV